MIDWMDCESYKPNEVGIYAVVTARGAVILDRWDGETWGRCTPRMSRTKRHGKYPPHRCWTFLPRVPSEAEIKRK